MARITFNQKAAVPTTPAAGKSSVYVLSTDKMVKVVDEAGLITPLNNVQIASTVAASAAIANSDTKIGAGLQVGANTLTAGSLIRFTILGTCTAANASAQVFTVRFGTNNTTADTAQCTLPLTADSTGTNIPFKIVIDITIRTIGASGTIYGYGSVINNTTDGIIATATAIVLVTNIATINTTAAGYIGLSYVSGHASTAATFQQVITELIRQ